MLSRRIPRVGLFVFLFFSVIGFIDATYLTIEHFLDAIPPCSITNGCSAVLTSEWSQIFGIPIALLGVFYYLSLMIAVIIFIRNGHIKALIFAALATILGFTVSLLLVSLQLFVIKQICFYCMISAAISTTLFVTGIIVVKKYLKTSEPAKSPVRN